MTLMITGVVMMEQTMVQPIMLVVERLEELIHFDRYDMHKFLRNDDFLKYLERIRALGRPGYRVAIGEEKG